MRPLACLLLRLLLLIASTWTSVDAEPAARVKHSPETPHSGEKVVLTLQPTSELSSAQLEYQPVLPGNYIPLADPAYARSWTNLPMIKIGDAWQAEIPAAVQSHRA